MDISEGWGVLAGGGAVAGVGLIGRILLRFWSRSRVEDASDKSEITQIARLEMEVKRQTARADTQEARADTAYRERNEAIEKGARAIGEVTALRLRIEVLEGQIRELKELLQSFYTKPR